MTVPSSIKSSVGSREFGEKSYADHQDLESRIVCTLTDILLRSPDAEYAEGEGILERDANILQSPCSGLPILSHTAVSEDHKPRDDGAWGEAQVAWARVLRKYWEPEVHRGSHGGSIRVCRAYTIIH